MWGKSETLSPNGIRFKTYVVCNVRAQLLAGHEDRGQDVARPHKLRVAPLQSCNGMVAYVELVALRE